MAAVNGLNFQHDSGATGNYYMPEIMGAGIALLDYDNDDDLDIFVLQGKRLDPQLASGAMGQTADPGHHLYRNDLNPSGHLQFTGKRVSGVATVTRTRT